MVCIEELGQQAVNSRQVGNWAQKITKFPSTFGKLRGKISSQGQESDQAIGDQLGKSIDPVNSADSADLTMRELAYEVARAG
jgi:hypothetical protein